MTKNPQTIIGQSPALAVALDHLSLLAGINRPVLILGERGTGKELAAERVHYLSARWSGVFMKVNCGAITETLLESELFGHEVGAFTGATRQHIGRFELADGGSLFLDELGTMSLRLQEKLLRLIEYGEFERVGGQKTRRVDVRVIAATHADLPAMADRGEFRWDLLDRLSFDVVRLPPLRERIEDIDELAHHFGVKLCAELGREVFPGFSDDALAALQKHPWPGNIRELKNAVERSVFRWNEPGAPVAELFLDPFQRQLSQNQNVSPALADEPVAPNTPTTWPINLNDWLKLREREWLIHALEASEHQQKSAASNLSLSYHQFRNLMRKHGLRTRPKRRSQFPKEQG